MDPAMGIVGAAVIMRWSVGLIRDTGGVLLDAEVPFQQRNAIKVAVETGGGTKVTDLHLWRVGPRHLAAIVAVVTSEPLSPVQCKDRLRRFEDLVHVTVEVNTRDANGQA
jgi:Co/Zn/Cd efflux system component